MKLTLVATLGLAAYASASGAEQYAGFMFSPVKCAVAPQEGMTIHDIGTDSCSGDQYCPYGALGSLSCNDGLFGLVDVQQSTCRGVYEPAPLVATPGALPPVDFSVADVYVPGQGTGPELRAREADAASRRGKGNSGSNSGSNSKSGSNSNSNSGSKSESESNSKSNSGGSNSKSQSNSGSMSKSGSNSKSNSGSMSKSGSNSKSNSVSVESVSSESKVKSVSSQSSESISSVSEASISSESVESISSASPEDEECEEEVETEFFGQEVTSRRIAYVIDYSLSMRGTRDTLMRAELGESVAQLGNDTDYAMVFFAGPAWVPGDTVRVNNKETATVTTPTGEVYKWKATDRHAYKWFHDGAKQPVSWRKGTPENLAESATDIVESPLVWGTRWDNPINMVLDMDPQPEEIYFMTDGAASGADVWVAEVGGRAAAANIVINTVALMQPRAHDDMKKLAEMTGGQFTIVEDETDVAAREAEVAGKWKKNKNSKKSGNNKSKNSWKKNWNKPKSVSSESASVSKSFSSKYSFWNTKSMSKSVSNSVSKGSKSSESKESKESDSDSDSESQEKDVKIRNKKNARFQVHDFRVRSRSWSRSGSGSNSNSASKAKSVSSASAGSASAEHEAPKPRKCRSKSQSVSVEEPVPVPVPVYVPPTVKWTPVNPACYEAPTMITVNLPHSWNERPSGLAEAAGQLWQVASVAADIGAGGAFRVATMIPDPQAVTGLASVVNVDAAGRATIPGGATGTATGVVRVTVMFTVGYDLGPFGSQIAIERPVTMDIPFTINVAGSIFRRAANVAQAQFDAAPAGVWMAFMGACLSVMVVSVAILGWFAYAVVSARATTKVEIAPLFASSA